MCFQLPTGGWLALVPVIRGRVNFSFLCLLLGALFDFGVRPPNRVPGRCVCRLLPLPPYCRPAQKRAAYYQIKVVWCLLPSSCVSLFLFLCLFLGTLFGLHMHYALPAVVTSAAHVYRRPTPCLSRKTPLTTNDKWFGAHYRHPALVGSNKNKITSH